MLPLLVVAAWAAASVAAAQVSWTTVFFDDFQRANGAPGPNWLTGLENQPPAAIQGGQLCSRCGVPNL